MRGWLWIPALLGVAFTFAALDRDSGIASWLRLRSELAAAQGRIAALDTEIAQLDGSAKALESDDFAIERAIREDLGYARPGETILRLPRADLASPRFP